VLSLVAPTFVGCQPEEGFCDGGEGRPSPRSVVEEEPAIPWSEASVPLPMEVTGWSASIDAGNGDAVLSATFVGEDGGTVSTDLVFPDGPELPTFPVGAPVEVSAARSDLEGSLSGVRGNFAVRSLLDGTTILFARNWPVAPRGMSFNVNYDTESCAPRDEGVGYVVHTSQATVTAPDGSTVVVEPWSRTEFQGASIDTTRIELWVPPVSPSNVDSMPRSVAEILIVQPGEG
jgi:hypothetical protein